MLSNVRDVSRWRKSSYSFSNGNCAEVAAWRKSSHSSYNGNCAEVGHGPGTVGIRDSQLGDMSPVLEFSSDEWTRFTAALKNTSAAHPLLLAADLPSLAA